MDEQQRDPELWKMATKRANFKRGLITYAWVNILLWGIWFLSSGRHEQWDGSWGRSIPWPAWVTFFWGIGIVADYFKAYGYSKGDLAEKEYEKLKREKQDRS